MRVPQFRLQTLMIATALAALVFSIIAAILSVDTAISEFYRPGGTLDRQQQRSATATPVSNKQDGG